MLTLCLLGQFKRFFFCSLRRCTGVAHINLGEVKVVKEGVGATLCYGVIRSLIHSFVFAL